MYGIHSLEALVKRSYFLSPSGSPTCICLSAPYQKEQSLSKDSITLCIGLRHRNAMFEVTIGQINGIHSIRAWFLSQPHMALVYKY